MRSNFRNTSGEAKNFARRLRKSMSKSEWALWASLRSKQLGFVVRRQFAVGPYVLDFFVYEARLCIEVDGDQHDVRTERDSIRDDYLANLGIATVRIPSVELFGELDTSIDRVYAHCCVRTGRDPLGLRG